MSRETDFTTLSRGCAISLLDEFPEELHAKERGAVPFADGKEVLYRRISEGDIDRKRNRVLESAWSSGWPNVSVNRSAFSGPEHVRFPARTCARAGAAQIKYHDVPFGARAPEAEAQGSRFLLQVTHQPLEHNYAHSEIRCIKEASLESAKKASEAAKSQLRSELSDAAQIVLEPIVEGD